MKCAALPNDLRTQLLDAEVAHPQPGQLLLAVSVRRPHQSMPSVLLVDARSLTAPLLAAVNAPIQASTKDMLDRPASAAVEVWWLVGPQGSGKSTFASRTIAEYQERGLYAMSTGDLTIWKSSLRYVDGVRHLSAVVRESRGVRARRAVNLLMVEVQEAPSPHDRHFDPRDRVIHFPLAKSVAVTAPASRKTRVLDWLRDKLWIWLAALTLTVIVGHEKVLIDDGEEIVAAHVRDVFRDERIADVTELVERAR